ncbi:MAG TPA: quinolinate synthase NadA [Methanoregulaceae archaeon]|nr:MAG: quinolinate synthase NadA [Methanolinea sp.]HON81581.1 quinolinate synthase NadA [Methanoregulaceae archaeon]HPD10388.1 quinolinate synthase NadA [Methanoregulaceae archaeon]HRT15330.1 quinolinate synthase NadA [Methanoregulaceae archaeon]HRU30980.1 quinolinate synthase NadA [Methanoregulaceae archaeon]
MRIQDRIRALKEERGAVILAHNYQRPEIQDVADIVGDSLELAISAKETDAAVIVLCGVDFMAETAKILNPGKTVLLPVKDATCPMAHQLTPDKIREARAAHPEASVVLYVNSTAESKALADIVCTSANAVKVVRSLRTREVLFGPDCNLAAYVQNLIPEKEIIPVPEDGHCYVHEVFTPDDLDRARKRGGRIICHPECRPEIQKGADVIASTGGMVRAAPGAETWNVLTERGMGYRLERLFPTKTFYTKQEAICVDMKKTTLQDLFRSLERMQYEVILDPVVASHARAAIDRMIALGR